MTEQVHNPNALYMPRTGEAIDAYIDILSRPPEHALSQEEQSRVYDFREGLLVGSVEVGNKTVVVQELGEPETLEDIEKNHQYSKDKHEISIDYFLTDAGKDLLTEKGLANEFGLEGYTDAKSMRLVFKRIALQLDYDDIKDLAQKSKQATDAQLAGDIASGKDIIPPDRLWVFSDATNMTRQLTGLLAYKNFYGSVRAVLKSQQDSVETSAKRALVDIYSKQVNGELASIYPDVFAYVDQVRALDDVQKNVRLLAVHNLLPHLVPIHNELDAVRRGRFLVRLDRIRNGASKNHGERTAINPELEQYLHNQEQVAVEEGIFTATELKILDSIKFNAQQMKFLAEQVMQQLGILSEYSTDDFLYEKDRPTRAPDGKWQVVIRDDIEAMTAEDPRGCFEIPANFNRSLTKSTAPVGVIPGLAHELEHCFQQDNIRYSPGGRGMGKGLPGRRNDAYFEAGAIGVERTIQSRLFGRTREDSPHYLRALVALEAGATEVDAVRVFYNSYKQANPNETDSSAAKVAVSRVMRLARRYGGYNSQPLNYSESGLLLQKTQQLDDSIKSMLFDSGAFELADVATLHSFGLLPKHVKSFPYDEFIAIVTPKLRKLIEEHKK